MHTIPRRAQLAYERSVAEGFEAQLPRVLALLLQARKDPAGTLNALYQPLAREHLLPGSDRERFGWPP